VETSTVVLDGRKCPTLEAFYDHIAEVMGFPAWWGRNLDALDEMLRGDDGATQKRVIRWRNAESARTALGFPETVCQLEQRLARCHPASRGVVEQELQAARSGQGPTVFEWLVDALRESADLILE
jgi:RNAse (barnase) inhibitor barstar